MSAPAGAYLAYLASPEALGPLVALLLLLVSVQVGLAWLRRSGRVAHA